MAEFVEDEFVEELEDNTSGDRCVNLKDTFDDLVRNKKSGLDDLSYSSDKDDDNYDNNMEEEAILIEYSDVKNVHDGQRQTKFILGGPKPPTYSGMNAVEKALAKAEYTKKGKDNTQMGCKWNGCVITMLITSRSPSLVE